jgi:CBS domain-containing protein
VTFAPGRRRARLAGRSFREIVTKLRECRVSAFPVLDADGKAIGVVSEADLLVKEAMPDEPNVIWGLLACIVHHAVQAKAGAVTAADLITSPAVTIGPGEKVEHAARLMVIMGRSEPSWYSVIVKDGVVTLEGTPETVAIGRDLVRRVQHVQGVVAVRDRLVYPVPPVPDRPLLLKS